MQKQEKYLDILNTLGLSDHESRIYLAGISLGPTTILHLAEAAQVKRTTVYSVVEALIHKGLMRVDVKGFKKLYAVESPDTLEKVLEIQRIRLKRALPEFEALYNLRGGQSIVRYYEGIAGMKVAYDELLESIQPKDDYLVISNIEYWHSLDPEYFEDFTKRRAKEHISLRMLLQDSELARKTKQFERNIHAQVRMLGQYTNLTTNLVVVPSRVLIQQVVQPIVTLVIENPSIVQLHREMFENMWQGAQ
jgi:HTH-type transcriptional regulator, sugar sensing transcriptional regulator